MNIRQHVIITTVTMLFGISVLKTNSVGQANDQPDIKLQPSTGTFAVYGDIRFTDASHCLMSSAYARKALIERIANLSEKPDFVALTGDIVYRGDDSKDWSVFDDETKPFRDQSLQLFAVLGNHDLRGATGQSNFVEHFEELKKHSELKTRAWYSLEYGNNTHFILLDSQSSYAGGSPQGQWLTNS